MDYKTTATPRTTIGDIPVFCAFDELVDMEKIIPNPKNPNQHPPEQVSLLAKIIRAQGWRAPITVSNRSGFVVRGHGRLMAAHALGIDKAPVDYQNYATEAEEYADLVADNRLSELSEMENDKLAEILSGVDPYEIDMEMFGYTEEEIEEILSDFQDDPSEFDGDQDAEAEPSAEPVTKTGDIWKVGRHRLICGDSTDRSVASRLFDGDKADICITSPPYGAGRTSRLRKKYVKGNKELESFYNDHDDQPDGWIDLIRDFFSVAKEFTESQFINLQMLADNKRDMVRWLNDNVENLVDIIVWEKAVAPPQMSENVLNNGFEFVFIFDNENGTRKIRFGDFHGTVKNVITVDREVNEFSDIHKAVFPVAFVDEILAMNGKAKTVYEPFCGTGTTMISCEKNRKACYGVEMDPLYCDTIVKRYAMVTGKTDIALIRNGAEIPVEETGLLN